MIHTLSNKSALRAICTVILLVSVQYLFSQSLHGNWHSEENDLCMVLDSTSQRVGLNTFYSKRIRYKTKDEELLIKWKFSSGVLILPKKLTFSFRIMEKSDSTLTLLLVEDGHGGTGIGMLREDFINSDTIVFEKKKLEQCTFHWNGKEYYPKPSD